MRAAEWLRSRRFPARAPIVVLDPYGFRRALRELGWEPARLVVAERFVPRLRGLTGFPAPDAGAPAAPTAPDAAARKVPRGDMRSLAMGFPRCRSVHTCFMNYPIDVAFLDASGRAIEVHAAVGPWKVLSCPGAVSVLERPTPRGHEPPSLRLVAPAPSPPSYPDAA
ncbi:DUF192 domain-containing protein [Collinsella intestinalis]|nr:DUF192 domain-containing protein [Collinsella intestinalis]